MLRIIRVLSYQVSAASQNAPGGQQSASSSDLASLVLCQCSADFGLRTSDAGLRLRLHIDKLQIMEAIVNAPATDQVFVGADLTDGTAVDHHEALRPAHGGEPMCDHHDRSTRH